MSKSDGTGPAKANGGREKSFLRPPSTFRIAILRGLPGHGNELYFGVGAERGKAVAGGDEGERWCHRPFQGGNEERKTRRTEFTEDTE